MQPTLSIVIVNWNGISFLPDCLQSIVDNPPSVPYEIVVVDNDSTDASVEWLNSDECKSVLGMVDFKLIESRENLGFGRANNLAFEKTASPFMLVLNPDSKVTSGAIDQLLRVFETDNQIGIVGPMLLNEDGSLQPSVCRYPESPASIIIIGLQLDRVIPRRFLRNWLLGNSWEHDHRREVPVVSGAAMMCRRAMVNDVGAFDPTIHMYAEELEWCVRIRRKGWKIFFEPAAKFYHFRGKSSVQRWSDSERLIVQEKALIYFQNKSFSRLSNFLNSLTRSLLLSVSCLRWKLRGRNASILIEMMKLHLNNCYLILSARSGREIV
jgi:GT2 family glycosyltransferase